MANHNFPFQVDSFGNMQQGISQHPQGQQQPIAGVPDVYTHGWSEVTEQFRLSNGAVGGPSAGPGGHQMNQQLQGMPQNMNLMPNQALGTQMQRQAPRILPNAMNTQNQYQPSQQPQQPQHHPLQFNQNNMVGNMPVNSNPASAAAAAAHLMGRQNPPPIFPPSTTNINPAVAIQLQKINNGIAPNQVLQQRPPANNNPGNLLQQSSMNWQLYEQRIAAIQEQAKLAIQSNNLQQMRQSQDAAAELQKKSSEERARWMNVFQQVRANGANDNTAKQVETWYSRYQNLYDRSERIAKTLEGTIANSMQQHQNAANMMGGNFPGDARNNGNGGSSGINSTGNQPMNSQQQWNNLQRDSNGNPGAVHNQSPFGNQPSNRPGMNGTNYGANFPANSNNSNNSNNNNNQQPGDFNNRPGGMPPVNNPAQPEPNSAVKDNFLKFLSAQNVETAVTVAGRRIELWDLWHAVRRLEATQTQPTNPLAKFFMVGAQLGLPIDANGRPSWQYVEELQRLHNRVTMALQNVRNNPHAQAQATAHAHAQAQAQAAQVQAHAQQAQAQAQAQAQGRQNAIPQTSMHGAQTSQINTMLLQTARKNYPQLDFNGITQDMVMNLPPQRFEVRIKSYIQERMNVSNNPMQGNTPQLAPRTPVPGPVVVSNPRAPTPVHPDLANSNGQMHRPNNGPVLNTEEIMKLHEQCQTVFRKTYETHPTPPFPMPPNIPLWKDRYGMAMKSMKPLLMGMGLYLYIRRDKDEMHTIIQKCVILVKQRQMMASHIILSIQGLEEVINYLHPRAQDFQDRIHALGPSIPPALKTLTDPSNEAFSTLGGLLPSAGPVPNQNHPPTPVPGRTTPAPPVAMPTPPHLPGQMQNTMGPNLTRQRRNGFSDAPGSISSPGFHTSPAPIPTSASPAAPSPPKAGKTTRPRGGAAAKRKPSRATNTPTPINEPVSTPTPAASAATPAPTVNSVGPKRSFDESEAPSSQSGSQPPTKRVKTEPSPPAVPQKPPTPPPQISAPIDRAEIRTAEDAKELLTETFKKAEEQETISQSQGQNSQDLIQWLEQIISGSNDAGPSTLPTNDLGSLVGLTNEVPETQLDGADIEFFDYGAYFLDVTPMPELDKRATLSPESHNDATTTPPQTNVPAHSSGKAGEQKAAANGTLLAPAVKVEDVQIGSSESDLLDAFLQSAGFSFDAPVEPLEEPWAIA